MPINRKWVDYDLTVIPSDHEAGLLEETHEQIMASAGMLSSFQTEYPELMLTKKKRKELAIKNWKAYRRTLVKIYSQSNTSACVGFGSAQALEITTTRRYGRKNHHSLSGMSVYKNIGNTIRSGAMISDGMKQIANVGALPLKNDKNDEEFDLTWGLLDWSKKFPRGWKSKVPFRVAKWGKAQGEDEIDSALANGFCGIVGRSRHCVPYFGLYYEGNDSFAPFANSWGSNWGDKGVGYDSLRTRRNLVMYLILEVTVPPSLEIPNL
jgi:hypothetical protein|tara:strand:- start:126 stop:923 length:798 start_codon:yes stop_codon:yes gene_type:complete